MLRVVSAAACSCGDGECNDVGKHPQTRKGLSAATTVTSKIRAWRRKWPSANVAIATGPSDLVVIDIDPQHGGDKSFAALRDEIGRDQFDTIKSLTGGGRQHLIYHATSPVRNSRGKLGSGIDIRAAGGYIIAPPSLHKSGRRYTWESECAPMLVKCLTSLRR